MGAADRSLLSHIVLKDFSILVLCHGLKRKENAEATDHHLVDGLCHCFQSNVPFKSVPRGPQLALATTIRGSKEWVPNGSGHEETCRAAHGR